MINGKMMGIVFAAFVAGSFVASPELRAYAANTVGSIDIIDGSIRSVDIKNGEVKTADLGGNSVTSAKIMDGQVRTADLGASAVTSAKIADGTVAYADLARSSVVVEHRNDCNCGGTGWSPDGTSSVAPVYDDAVTANSVIAVSTIGHHNIYCQTRATANGYFIVQCNGNIPDGAGLNYAIFNHP